MSNPINYKRKCGQLHGTLEQIADEVSDFMRKKPGICDVNGCGRDK